jgi:hypothetical protein
MRSWRISSPHPSGQLSTARVTDLVMAISHADADALAASMLKTVGDTLPVSQCTIFAYEFDARPRTVSAAVIAAAAFYAMSPIATPRISMRSTATAPSSGARTKNLRATR